MKTTFLPALCAMIPAAVFAATSIGVREPEPPGAVSAQVGVALSSSDTPVAMQADVLFDSALYEVTSAVDGTQPDGVQVQSRLMEAGRLRVVVHHRSDGALEDDLVFQIPLTAKSGVVDAEPVVLANFIVAGQGGGALATSILPRVRLLGLKDDQRVNGRLGLELTAAASATGGPVSRVDYYVGDQLLGSGTGAYFRFVWMPPSVGPFLLRAVAYDSNGLEASSRETPVIVQHVDTFAGQVKGTYYGLIRTQGFDFSKNGYAVMTSATTGAFTAKLTLGGVSLSASGKFDDTGSAYVTIPATKTRPAWYLTLTESSVAAVSQIHGRLSDGSGSGATLTGATFVAEFTADKFTWNAKTNKPLQAGAYTLAFPAAGNANAVGAPLGDGYATATVSTGGTITMSGKLADNTALSQSTFLSKDGLWPLYALLYSKKGMALGEMQFRDVPGVSDVDGTVEWFRPVTTTTAIIPFKPGFQTQLEAVGSKFVKPTPYTRLMETANEGGNTLTTVTDGGLGSSVTSLGTLRTTHAHTVPFQSSEKLSLKPNVSKGLLTGSFVHPLTQLATPLSGVLLQKQNLGTGFFLSKLNSGGFTWESNPDLTATGAPLGVKPLPVIKIASPRAEATLPNTGSIVISGSASDGQGVAAVEVRVLHDSVLSDAAVATGTTAWTHSIPLTAADGGRYQVFAKARDTAGNESDPVELGFWVAKKSDLTVAVVGPGTVPATFLGTTQRDTGKLVTLSATPLKGKKFTGWTGSVISPSAKITFMMKDGISLTANFAEP